MLVFTRRDKSSLTETQSATVGLKQAGSAALTLRQKVLVRLIEGDITPGRTVRRDFEASVKRGSKRKKIIIQTNLRTVFWRFVRSVSLSFYSSTEEASG